MYQIPTYLNFALSLQLLLLTLPVQAEFSNLPGSNNPLPTEINFEPPEDGEKPNTVGAGTRNPDELRCESDSEPVKAIMPPENYGLTLQEHPSIFIHVPETSAKQVVLAIQDSTEAYHEVAFLPIPTDASIVSFSLPSHKPSLIPGTYYKWKLTLVCGNNLDVDDPYLQGWLKRIDAAGIESQLQNKTTLEKADWYSKHGYWYDLLQEIQQAQQDNPDNSQFLELWQNLLQKSEQGEI